MATKKAFSLIELMIVIVIIGAFATIMIASFDYSERTAENESVDVEMYNIRKAFVAYYKDNFPDFSEYGSFHLVSRFGLAVLCEKNSNYYDIGLSSDEKDLYDLAFADKDLKNKIGWQAPYITQEGRKTVKISTAFSNTTIWQNDSSYDTSTSSPKDVSIPVVQDPFGGYYRLIIPKGTSGNLGDKFLPQYAYLVCTGVNNKLETFSTHFDDKEDSSTYLQLVPQGDDKVLMIFPEYTY